MRLKGKDKRITGEGAVKGWATRRRRIADRSVALTRLIAVAESMTGEVVTKTPVPGYPNLMAVRQDTVINWRERITSALRILGT